MTTQDQEPLPEGDAKLPFDVTVGHGTHRKGTSLRSLIRRMQMLYDMAHPKLTQAEMDANLALLQGGEALRLSATVAPAPASDTVVFRGRYYDLPATPAPASEVAPIDMVLHCPSCGMQHIDAPEEHHDRRFLYSWENPPHRSHLCAGCGHIWRPADVPTNGVVAVKTKGKADSASPSTPRATELTNEQLAKIAYDGFDNYWTEDCKGLDREAWAASARAVIAALRPTEQAPSQPTKEQP